MILCKSHSQFPEDKTSDEYYIVKGNDDADKLATGV